MKKSVLLLSVGLFLLTACNNQKSNSAENANEQIKTEEANSGIEKPVGGDKDEHGCLSAAGETWSELKQGCIQVFNVGERLNPVETKQGEAVISAFVLFSDDKSKVELFLADQKPNTILDKSEDGTYQKDIYKFDAKESVLYIKGEKRYIAAN